MMTFAYEIDFKWHILSFVAKWRADTYAVQGRIQDFKLGGGHLKKLRRAEGGAKYFEVFRVKNHDFTPKKIIFFSNFRGGGGGGAPGSAPAIIAMKIRFIQRHIQPPH